MFKSNIAADDDDDADVDELYCSRAERSIYAQCYENAHANYARRARFLL